MSTDREVTRIVRSWLETDGATVLPDRVLDAVLDQVPATPQRRSWRSARRIRDMNNALKLAMAAAAVVAVVAVAANLPPGRAVVGGLASAPPSTPSTPSPTRSLTPTPTPRPSSSLPSFQRSAPQLLTTGTYREDDFVSAFTMNIPAGWTGLESNPGFVLLVKTANGKPFGTVGNDALLGVYVIRGVYHDPCKDREPASPAPATVADLVQALTHQVGVRTGPVTDAVVSGVPARVFDMDGLISKPCVKDPSSQWAFLGYGPSPVPENNSQARAHNRIWVLERDGALILVNAQVGNDAPHRAELAETFKIVASIKFE